MLGGTDRVVGVVRKAREILGGARQGQVAGQAMEGGSGGVV